jgi:hypothetical protein
MPTAPAAAVPEPGADPADRDHADIDTLKGKLKAADAADQEAMPSYRPDLERGMVAA